MFLSFLALVLAAPAAAQLRIETGGHIGQVAAAVALPDGGFATLGYDKTVRFWTSQGEGRGVARYPSGVGSDGYPTGLGVGKDRVVLGSVLAGGGGAVYRVAPDGTAQQIAAPAKAPAVALFDEGRTLATLDAGLKLQVGPPEGPRRETLVGDKPLGADGYVRLAASPDGKRLVTAVFSGGETRLAAYDAASLKPLGKPAVVSTFVWAVADGKDGVWIAGDGYAGLWKVGEAPKKLGLTGAWIDVAANPKGGALFVGSGADGKGRAAAVGADGAPRPSGSGELGPVSGTAVAIDREGQALVGTQIGDLFLLDATGKARRVGPAPELAVDLAWSKNGAVLEWKGELDAERRKASGYDHAFDLAEQHPTNPVPADDGRKLDPTDARAKALAGGGEVYAAAVLPNGRVVASTQNGGLQADAGNGKTVRLDCEGFQVTSLAVSPDGRYLAAAGSDGVVRLFVVAELRGETVRPEMSLFARGRSDWILWSDRECLYASSVDGDRLLNVQRTLDNGAVLFEPVATRENAYRRPAALRKAFAQASVAEAVAGTPDAAKPALAATASARIQLVPAIAGATRQPDGGFVATTPTVKLKFRVSEGVKMVRLSENVPTKDVAVASLGSEGSDQRVLEANLTPGENRLKIVGVREDGTTSEPIEIRIRLDAAPIPGTMRVLVVGVTGYRAIPDLPTNAQDAAQIAAHFQALKGKLPGTDVAVTLLPEAQTDHAGVRRALEIFQAGIGPNDVVVLYVSSHGMKGAQGFVMLPRDFDPQDANRQGIAWQTVVDAISTKPCKAAVLIQDACHSGGAIQSGAIQGGATKDGAAADDPGLKDAREAADRLARRKNLYVFSSCQASEVSYVDKLHGQSVFTLALLQGLSGQLPDAVNLDDKVLLSRLGTPVVAQVERIIRDLVKKEALPQVVKGGALVDPAQEPQLYSPWREVSPIVMGVKG